MFATVYLGWKPAKVETKVPTYQEMMLEFERRMDLMNRPRQLEKPAGPSAADVFAEVERRLDGR